MTDIVTQLSKLLYEHDPMGTCCKENECLDEYDFTAAHVAELLDEGEAFKQALKTAFSASFSDEMAGKVDYQLLEDKFILS